MRSHPFTFMGLSGSGSVLLLFLPLLALLGSVTADGPRAHVGDWGEHSSVYVESYAEGAMRLVVKPKDVWSYEVEHARVAQPLESVAVSCQDATCVATTAECQLNINLANATVATAEYTCAQTAAEVKLEIRPVDEASRDYHSGYTYEDAEGRKTYTLTSVFPKAKTMYGLAEHAADLPLRQGHVYALANTDAFEYPVNSTARLYGSIPFIMAYSAASTTGLLFLNAAIMDVEIPVADAAAPEALWRPTAGIVDVTLFPGPTPAAVQRQHSQHTGTSLLPPYFSLGYHQSRWNYMNLKDSLTVDESFDVHGMPYDALWLDIEHLDGKKPFTWDYHSFPHPEVLVEALASKGRRLVTVRDPHVRRAGGYHVHEEAAKGNHYVLANMQGDQPYIGKCWPGESSWPDFMNTRTRDWYATLFHNERYPHGGPSVHTWVDMNEPSVFEGADGTMHGTAVHRLDDGHRITHRYVHNMYSLVSIMSAYDGAANASAALAGSTRRERPFILTRSFFPGTQRYAAMWNGDNFARWDHLQNTLPELLSLSLSNYAFVGSDVGGFFGDTEEELFVRWMQAGVFFPFFRGHAHMETKRREPYSFGSAARQIMRTALALRYALVPYIYTAFYHAHTAGTPIMRPLVYDFPEQESLREEQNSFMFGPALLARPVVEKSAEEVRVTLPRGVAWYDYESGRRTETTTCDTGSSGALCQLTRKVSPSTIPLYLRGGSVVPMKLRLRRSTAATRLDPFTLYVALDDAGAAAGDLYVDDGATYEYTRGVFSHRGFAFANSVLRCSAATAASSPPSDATFTPTNVVERVVFFGYSGSATKARLRVSGEDTPTELEVERTGTTLIVRKPDAPIALDWTIELL